MLGRARSSTTVKKLTTSPRWADIAVSSDDDLSDVEIFGTRLPTVNEDSYRSKPDSALDDSKTGVNAAMRALTPHSHPQVQDAPKDFGFLLQGRRRCADLEPGNLDKENTEANLDSLDSLETSSQVSKSESPGQVPRSKQGQLKKRRKPTGTPTLQRKRGRVSPGNSGAAAIKSRCTSATSDSMSEKSDPPLTEDHDSLDSASVGGCSLCSLDRGQIPEATEEEWQRREELRVKAIELGKKTAAYQRFCAAVPEKDRILDSCIVRTPNPLDRTISKRKWKEIVHEWRKQLWMHFGDEAERKSCEDAAEVTPKIEQGEPEGV